MDKQTTIAFVLIGIILVVWLYINAPEPQERPPATDPDSTLVEEEKPSAEDKADEKLIEENIAEDVPQDGSLFVSEEKDERIITIDNNIAKLELTSKGGRIRKAYLKNYKTWYHRRVADTNFYDSHVQLINTDIEGGDLNVVFVTKDGKLVNTKNLYFETNKDSWKYNIADGDSLVVEYKYNFGEDRSITKTYTFYGDKYNSKVDIELNNLDEIISSYTYDLIWETGVNFTEDNSVDEATFSNASAFSGGEQVVIDASSHGEKVERDLTGTIDWVGIKTKYFGMILAPKNPSPDGGAYFSGIQDAQTKYGTREYYSAALKVSFKNQSYQKDSFELYLGPMDYGILSDLGNNYDAIYDFGSIFGLQILRPISEYVILPLFQFLHRFIPNYGFVIVVFTLIIKFALYPLTKQSYKSMKRMQKLQPKIKELKEKYKDDPQRVQKETMKLYSTYGINPAGGCLPMLLQMPILFALFTFFKVTIEIRQEPFILWITNLSSPDVIATLPFRIPIFGVDQVSGLALLLGITMFLQQKMSIKDPSQKALVYIMPVMFTVLFMSFPSGLNLYYFMFNLFSIIQQYFINRSKDDEELEPVKNPKKKKGGGFMQRMMEAAEKQQQLQRESQRQAKKKKKKF